MYAEIKGNDATNGIGVCVSVWMQGCPHRCKGCHNSNLWEFEGGQLLDGFTRHEILDRLNENGVDRNLSILGGEPLCKENLDEVTKLVHLVKTLFPTKQIIVWTGYKYEEVKDLIVMKYIDVLIDGRFDIDKKDVRLKLRVSSNQIIIDLHKMRILKDNKLYLWED